MAQAVAAINLQEPDHARARPSRYFKKEQYPKVFSLKVPIDLYVTCALLRKRAEAYLLTAESDRMHRNNLLFYVLMAVVSVKLKTPRANVKTIAGMKVGEIEESAFAAALAMARPIYKKLGPSDTTAKGSEMVAELKSALKAQLAKKAKSK